MRKIKLVLTALLVLVSTFAFAQKMTVKGTVKDAATGEPVPGTAIIEKGTSNAAISDANGAYSISVQANGTLVFSTLGYKEIEIAVDSKGVVDASLEVEASMLDDVIVVAFGTSTKESFTGSAKVVGSEDIATSQVSNAIQALNGKVAGVQMVSTTGSPASDGTGIRIRGFSSINAGQAPLIVLDGIPYDGSMNDINPNDIESMTVLKDAASNALYGARGANGVIMITTKKSNSREAVVNFDMKLGANMRGAQDYDYISTPAGYYEQHYKALYNSYIASGKDPLTAHEMANANVAGPSASGGLGYQVYTVPEGQYFIGSNGKVNPEATLGRLVSTENGDFLLTPDNWTNEIFRHSLRQEYNVSVNGGGEKTSFYASVGYLDNQGIVKKTDFNRLTARLRAEYQAKKWLKVGANAAYSKSRGNISDEDGVSNSSGNVFAYTTQVAPIYPLYVRGGDGKILVDTNGYTVYDYGDKSNAGLERPVFTGTNAIGDHYLNVRGFDANAFNMTGFADITFLKDFKFSVNIGSTLGESRSTSLTNGFYGSYKASNGMLTKEHERSFAYNFQQILNWKHKFGQHTAEVMLGHENYSNEYATLAAEKSNMFSPDNLELAGAIKEGASDSYVSSYNTEGFFGRAQYDYMEKIFVSGSYRRDASSRFHPDYRWGNFWSFGGAWIMSKESWFNAPAIDMWKLKASYGSQGNDSIDDYLYTDTYSITPSAGQVSAVLSGKGAKDITWETNGNFNAGVEFELLKNRISGSVEGFYRKTTDMLSWFTVPPSLGYTGYFANVGDMVNSGVEVELDFVPVRTKNITWTVNGNATFLKNKITKLAESRKTLVTPEGYEGYQSGNHFYGENLPLYTYYMKQYAGVDQSTGEPLWYQDVEIGDEVRKIPTKNYSEATEYVCGNPIPDVYGGFGTTLELYGFDLSLNFTYQIGGLVYDSGYALAMGSPLPTSLGNNYHADLLDAWTPEHTDTNVPRFQYNDKYNASKSDRFLTSSSFLNLQNINFGYTLPKKVTKAVKIEKLRLYCACENVWLWSARQGLDPRLSFTGSNNATTYSVVRTISGGLNITF